MSKQAWTKNQKMGARHTMTKMREDSEKERAQVPAVDERTLTKMRRRLSVQNSERAVFERCLCVTKLACASVRI